MDYFHVDDRFGLRLLVTLQAKVLGFQVHAITQGDLVIDGVCLASIARRHRLSPCIQ